MIRYSNHLFTGLMLAISMFGSCFAFGSELSAYAQCEDPTAEFDKRLIIRLETGQYKTIQELICERRLIEKEKRSNLDSNYFFSTQIDTAYRDVSGTIDQPNKTKQHLENTRLDQLSVEPASYQNIGGGDRKDQQKLDTPRGFKSISAQ